MLSLGTLLSSAVDARKSRGGKIKNKRERVKVGELAAGDTKWDTECLTSPTYAAALCQRLKVLPEEILLAAVSGPRHCPQSLIHTRHFCLLLLLLLVGAVPAKTLICICRICRRGRETEESFLQNLPDIVASSTAHSMKVPDNP